MIVRGANPRVGLVVARTGLAELPAGLAPVAVPTPATATAVPISVASIIVPRMPCLSWGETRLDWCSA